jgi:hypothetical protein
MADKYDALIDAYQSAQSGAPDKYDAMIDAIAPKPQQAAAVPPSMFDVSTHTAPPAGLAPQQGNQSGLGADFINGLLTNRPVDSFAGKFGRGVLPGALAMAAGPAGAAAGVGIQKTIGNLGAAFTYATGNDQPFAGPGEVAGDEAKSALLQKAAQMASPYLAKGLIGGTVSDSVPISDASSGREALNAAFGHGGEGTFVPPTDKLGGLAGGVRDAVSGIQNWFAKNMSGVKSASVDFAQKAPDIVSKYVGAAPDVGDAAGQAVKDAIEKTIADEKSIYGPAYKAAMTNPAYEGKTFNLADSVGPEAAKIGEEHQFTGMSPRVGPSEGADVFNKHLNTVAGLTDATPQELWQVQKTIGNAAQNVRDSNPSLSTALGRLSDKVKEFAGQNIPEIAQANDSWASAKAIEKETAPLTDSKSVLDYIGRTYAKPESNTDRQLLESASSMVPGLEQAINNVRGYNAGKDFSPIFRSLPQTGFIPGWARTALGGGALLGAEHAPIAAAATGTALAGLGATLSPRAALLGIEASKAMSPYAAQGMRGLAGMIPGLTTFGAQTSGAK